MPSRKARARAGGGSPRDVELDPRLAQGLDADPHEVDRAGDLQDREGLGAGQHERRHADGARRDVNEAAHAGADARGEAFVAAAGQGTRGDVEDARSRRHGDRQRRREEQGEVREIHRQTSGSGSPGGSGISKTLSVIDTSM